MVHPVVAAVTERIKQRSIEQGRRVEFLASMDAKASALENTTVRANCTSCSCLAHNHASADVDEKDILVGAAAPNIGIISAATDMLSAHAPFKRFPEIIKDAAKESGATAQILGHLPAICDGTVQGREGMDLSLPSRDTIAQAFGLAACHDTADGHIILATCDKIKPGAIIGAASFAYLPTLFAPGGPMETGQSNGEKNKVRQQRALEKKGEVEETVGFKGELRSEMRSYHGDGTCTFYGTANGNEMVSEIMGLHIHGTTFVSPNDPLRDMLTADATKRMVNGEVSPLYKVLDEKAFVNGLVAWLGTGGSTNLALHFPAMAKAYGIIITMEDIDMLSGVVQQQSKIYPNGPSDINGFQEAGGVSVLVRNLLNEGLLHEDVMTVSGKSIGEYTKVPAIEDGELVWKEGPEESLDPSVIRSPSSAEGEFQDDGGIKVLKAPASSEKGIALGVYSISKTSALTDDNRIIKAPAIVFDSQEALQKAYMNDKLDGKDFVAVVRGQGPHQNGMPELHQLITPLTNMQKKGQRVGLLTNGRLSGASGGILSSIHLSAANNNEEPINKVRDGDIITIDTLTGEQFVSGVSQEEWDAREFEVIKQDQTGLGRSMFKTYRDNVGPVHEGATIFDGPDVPDLPNFTTRGLN